jgi:predicted nucleic acid-binding protein
MPTEVVVDSSVIAAMVTPELFSDWSSKKLSKYDDIHGLDLNYYEVANAIRYKESDQFDASDVARASTQATELMNLFAIHDFSEIIAGAIAIALELDITVYDAAFLSLAKKLNTQLLTLDEKLAKKLEGTKYYGLVEYPSQKTSQT